MQNSKGRTWRWCVKLSILYVIVFGQVCREERDRARRLRCCEFPLN